MNRKDYWNKRGKAVGQNFSGKSMKNKSNNKYILIIVFLGVLLFGFFIFYVFGNGFGKDKEVDWNNIINKPQGLGEGDDFSLINTSSGERFSEKDPTVKESVKDGVSWKEIEDRPSSFANDSIKINSLEEVLNNGNNAGGKRIKNLSAPVDSMDAVTKDYVDSLDNCNSKSQSFSEGMYNNRIVNQSFSRAYTEVCFKNGESLRDLHPDGGSTLGGNCIPGDRGFVIEQKRRVNTRSESVSWTKAKANCLKDGMRLPEIFELQYSCINKEDFEITEMTPVEGSWVWGEWSTNKAVYDHPSIAIQGYFVPVFYYLEEYDNCYGVYRGYAGSKMDLDEHRNYDKRVFRCAR